MLREEKWQQLFLDAEEKISRAVLRLLRFCGSGACRVASLFELEQECLFVGRDFFSKRLDLMETGRSLVEGGERGQTRFFQVKSLVEKGSLLFERGAFLRDQLKNVGEKEGLIPLFHEKPFSKEKGLGCKFRWILQADKGRDLFDPKGDVLVFGALLAALFRGVHRHAPLIWASIASAGNDLRFNGPIHWIHWGEELRAWALQKKVIFPEEKKEQESISRWVGPEFVFSGVGASKDPFLTMIILQTVVANSLEILLDEWERELDPKASFENKWSQIKISLQEALHLEEKKIPKSYEAYAAFLEPAAMELLEEMPLKEIYDHAVQNYVLAVRKEVCIFVELFRTQTPLLIEEIEKIEKQIEDLGWEARAKVLMELILPKMQAVKK